MASSKKRLVVSFENLNPDYLAAFKEKYPKGYSDYMGDIFKVDKPDGSFFYAVSLEVEDAILLVKIKVKIDSTEDIEKEFFSEDDDVAEDGELADDVDSFADSDSNDD